MYLADNEIIEILGLLDIDATDEHNPFDPSASVQPASIDMRLDRIFWRQKKRRVASDLRNSIVEQLDARRFWRRLELTRTESVVIKPGEMLLGRVYERFTVPENYAARIVGRSSFARMGLSVTCSGDFINPGYRGHMPLELFNASSVPIRICPYLPVCQLVLVKLTSTPKRLYGHATLGSKYADDDGGPSYWWKDKSFTAFQDVLRNKGVAESIQDRVREVLGHREATLLERFEAFFGRLSLAEIDNADDVLKRFAEAESKARRRAKFWYWAPRTITMSLVAMTVGRLFAAEWKVGSYAIFFLTLLSLAWFGYAWLYQDEPGDYFDAKEFDRTNASRGAVQA